METLPHCLLLLTLVSACAGQEDPLGTELNITPKISFLPSDKIIEGDSLRVQCMVRGPLPPNLKILVMKGPTILKSGSQQAFWNMGLAQAADAGTYTCKAEDNGLQKNVSRSVQMTELFSKPVLTVQPVDVFEGEMMTFFCKSAHIVSQRVNANDVKYHLYKDNVKVADLPSGEYRITANLSYNGNYSCQAEAKSIQKRSLVFLLKIKELFSKPVLTVQPVDVFEGEMLTFSCKSAHIDSQRINANDVKYHLYKDNIKVADLPSGEYRITANLSYNGNYSCQAEAKSIQKRSLVFVLKIKVKNAPWKTAVIGSTIVLLLSIITVSSIYCIDKKDKRKEKETGLYFKASKSKPGASVAVPPAYTGYNTASHTVLSDHVERPACQSSGSNVFYAPQGTESSNNVLLKDQKSSQEGCLFSFCIHLIVLIRC